MNQISGGGIIAKMLKLEGVAAFFCIVDGTYSHFFTAMVQEGISMYSARHESVNAHMAGAYSRMTGKLGVAAASNGPGVANILSGAAVEHLEHSRVLLITSSRRTGCTDPDRIGAYQQFNQHAVIENMSKFSVYVRDFQRIPESVREALRHCWNGKPGLVHVDLPEDVMNQFGPEPRFLEPAQYRRIAPIYPHPAQVEAAALLLTGAHKPMIHAGSGISHALAQSELEDLAELLGAPVTMTWAAQGSLRDDSAWAVPMSLGKFVQKVRRESDVCLCLGAGLNETDYWGKFPYWAKTTDQTFIQVDHDELAIGRNRPVDVGIVGDVKVFMQLLIAELKKGEAQNLRPEREAFLEEVAGAKKAATESVKQLLASLPKNPIHTAEAVLTLKAMLPADTVFVRDGGNTATWSGLFGNQALMSQLTTWHMGHLGAGLGYAQGAAVARPGSRVCLCIGDGAFGMHMQEMETAVRYGLKILYVVVADQQWGMVKINYINAMKAHQERYAQALGEKGHVANTDIGYVDWVQVAQGMGLYAEAVETADQMGPAVAHCLEAQGPALIMVKVDPAAHLACPALASFREMHNEPAGDDGADPSQQGHSC